MQYLRLLVLPWPLNAMYAPPAYEVNPLSIAGTVVFIALLVFGDARRKLKYGVVSLVWVLVFLIPVSGVLPVATITLSERFLYLPSFGIALAAAHVLERGPKGFPVWKGLAAAALLAIFGLGTVKRAEVWRNDVSLFQDTAGRNPQSAFAHYTLGAALARADRLEESIAAYRQAIQLKKDHYKAYNNLGLALARSGRWSEAVETYEVAVRIKPDASLIWGNLGNANATLGRFGAAIAAYRNALDLAPRDLDARTGLIRSYAASGDMRAALEELERLKRFDAGRASKIREALLDAGLKR